MVPRRSAPPRGLGQATQRGTRDSGACLKAHCAQNLSSPISAVDIRHDDYEARIYSVACALARGHNRSRAADCGKITT